MNNNKTRNEYYRIKALELQEFIDKNKIDNSIKKAPFISPSISQSFLESPSDGSAPILKET